MTEEQLNEEYIRDNIGGICQDCMYLDEIVPIIRRMLSEAYIKGLEQYKFDLKMDMVIDKVAIPEELAKDADFENLLDMPSYEELHNRIKMALEYINDNVAVYAFNNKDLPHWEFNDDDMKELLEILRGDNND